MFIFIFISDTREIWDCARVLLRYVVLLSFADILGKEKEAQGGVEKKISLKNYL